MQYDLPKISFLKLRFRLAAETDCILPEIKGSMLRGAFGNALRKTVCVMKSDARCESCMLRAQCAYTRLFETFIENDPPPFLKGIRTSPRPFVIHEFDSGTHFKSGDSFSFTLTLLGKACEFHPYVIFSFIRAAENGFTKARRPFRLARVTLDDADQTLVYDGEKQAIVRQVTPQKSEANGVFQKPLRLEFLTPTRIKTKGKLDIPHDFRTFAFTMLRRLYETVYFHEPVETIHWDFKELLDRADQVRITERRLVWEDWMRYSSRQKTKLDMGGFRGHLVLEGDVAPFGPLLQTAEVLHVGKGTVLGMGRVKVEGNPPVVPL